MKTLNEIMNYKIDKSLNEEDAKPVSKGIFSEQGKKINLERMAKWFLGIQYSDDTIKNVTWLQYKKADVKSTASEYAETGFITSLVRQIKQFNKRVDLNMSLRNAKNKPFEQRVDIILKHGAKYPKTGLKA